MTSYERIRNQLQRKPVDRIGIFEHFWEDTRESWKEDPKQDPSPISCGPVVLEPIL